MAVKKPYEPPTYGVRSLAIERRLAGKAPASADDEDDKIISRAKSEPAPDNKMSTAPINKSAAKAPAKRKAK